MKIGLGRPNAQRRQSTVFAVPETAGCPRDGRERQPGAYPVNRV